MYDLPAPRRICNAQDMRLMACNVLLGFYYCFVVEVFHLSLWPLAEQNGLQDEHQLPNTNNGMQPPVVRLIGGCFLYG